MQRLAITRIERNDQSYIAGITLDEKREFVDFQVFEPENSSMLNNICVGRIENILPNINAAFVRIAPEVRCYLPLEDCKEPIYVKKQSAKQALSIGDELVVQVTREAIKTKEAVASTKLTLQGKYSVLTTENTDLAVSRKIPKEKRQSLQAFLREMFKEDSPFPDNSGYFTDQEEDSCLPPHRRYGIILRTDAVSCSREEIATDVQALTEKYQRLLSVAPHRTTYDILFSNPPAYLNWLKSIDKSHLDGIVTDQEDIFSQIKENLPYTEELLSLYEDKAVSLSTLYHINGNIDKLLSATVWLKSGSNIIIEQLETLTVIDVNTGKNIKKGKNDFLSVNLEAATEIARQLRLRNISGMILIDFINLKAKDEPELISHLKQELKKDYCPCNFVDITKLGLVELTRKKGRRSLREIFCG